MEGSSLVGEQRKRRRPNPAARDPEDLGHGTTTPKNEGTPRGPDERRIAPHPSLKPQALLRQLVRAALPLGAGIVLDPFLGGGSTVAAALAVGYDSIGIQNDPTFFKIAERAMVRLAKFDASGDPKGSVREGLALLVESARLRAS